jgi:hypothetical protein
MENIDIDGSIILRWVINKLFGKAWTGLVWLRIWIVCGLL